MGNALGYLVMIRDAWVLANVIVQTATHDRRPTFERVHGLLRSSATGLFIPVAHGILERMCAQPAVIMMHDAAQSQVSQVEPPTRREVG